MRILLLNPRFPESFWAMNSLQSVTGTRYAVPTLALPTLAALTTARHEVVIVDENVEEVDLDLPCDLVGITCMSVQGTRGFEIAAAFRSRGKMVVMGGSLPTLSPELCRPHADVIFIGEAERTWPKFLEDYEKRVWSDTYEEKERIDIKTTPVPRFDLLKMSRYFVQAVQFSRGCPYECEFCEISVMFGHQPRTKTVAQVLAEVDEIYRLGGRRIFIVDDNFIANKKKAKELLIALRDWNAAHGYQETFQIQISLNAADDDELLTLLHDARFVRLFIGIESPRKKSLEEAKKYQNTQGSILGRVHKIQSYGMLIQAAMIVGFDNDDESIFMEQESFIKESRIPQVMCGMLQAFPQTPLYDRMRAEGRLSGNFSSDMILSTNIIPKQMTKSALMRGYLQLLRNLYEFDPYAERAIDYLTASRKLEPIQPKRRSRSELLMFARFILYIFFGGNVERRRFSRRILLATLRTDAKRLPDAIYLAAVHKHFYEYVAKCVPIIEEEINNIQKEALPDTSIEAIA